MKAEKDLLNSLKKINFGCGDKKKEGYLNVDISEKCSPDMVWDVTVPFPAEDETIERIELDNLAEHLDRQQLIDVMNDFHRILKKGGTVWIKSPALYRGACDYPNLDAVFGDPTHRSFFTMRTFDYWSKDDPMGRWHNFGKDYGIKPFSSLVKKFDNLHGIWELQK